MDVVELEGANKIYRLVPQEGTLLKPIEIEDSEKTKKFVQVKSKTTIKNGKTHIGFHDGKTLLEKQQKQSKDLHLKRLEITC